MTELKTAAAKMRLDHLLVVRGHADNPSRARALLLEGRVFSGDRRLEKGGLLVDPDLPIEVRAGQRWVSRGALKLLAGLEAFKIEVRDKVALDVGASTGGFTQVLLERGAARVYAVDVGYGQLAWELRQDPRVIVLERTNARFLDRSQVPEPIDLVVCDASFISLCTVLPAPLALTTPDAVLVALIKPQFEVGKGKVGKGGVVRDPALHTQVCDRIRQWLETEMGWHVLGITESPISGPKGNREFLMGAVKRAPLPPEDVRSLPQDRG